MIFLCDNCLATVPDTGVPQGSAPALSKKPVPDTERRNVRTGGRGRFWVRQAGAWGNKPSLRAATSSEPASWGARCYQSVSAGAASRESGAQDTQAVPTPLSSWCLAPGVHLGGEGHWPASTSDDGQTEELAGAREPTDTKSKGPLTVPRMAKPASPAPSSKGHQGCLFSATSHPHPSKKRRAKRAQVRLQRQR